MRQPTYPSDLSDEQWNLVKDFIWSYVRGRPRKTSMRDVVDAILYLCKTGCQWAYLPKDFPPKSTVWDYFNEWRHDGTLEAIHDCLREQVRDKEKPQHPRRTASIDSQSVDTSSGGEAIGRDNFKNVDGRKRHILVDSLGLLLAVVVTAANVDDAAAAPQALGQMAQQPVASLQRVYADNKYHNHALYLWIEENGFYDLDVVRRDPTKPGWQLLPIRWMVERTFAWLLKCRRLSLDREKTTCSSEAMVHVAMIHLMLQRLAPKQGQAEFQYRTVA